MDAEPRPDPDPDGPEVIAGPDGAAVRTPDDDVPGVPPAPGEPARVDLDPALVEAAHPTEAQRLRRGSLLGAGFGVLLLALARGRGRARGGG